MTRSGHVLWPVENRHLYGRTRKAVRRGVQDKTSPPLDQEEIMDDVRMMRPAEAAEALGVSLARLRRLAACGRLVTVRTLGGHRRYREDDVLALQRWLQSRRAIGA
jgi:excisionase family DNA binding protein